MIVWLRLNDYIKYISPSTMGLLYVESNCVGSLSLIHRLRFSLEDYQIFRIFRKKVDNGKYI